MFENIPDDILDSMILEALFSDPDVQVGLDEKGQPVFWHMASVPAS